MGAEESRHATKGHVEEASFDFRNEEKVPSVRDTRNATFARPFLLASRAVEGEEEGQGRDLPKLMKCRSSGWIDEQTSRDQETRSRSSDPWPGKSSWVDSWGSACSGACVERGVEARAVPCQCGTGSKGR